MLKKEDNITD